MSLAADGDVLPNSATLHEDDMATRVTLPPLDSPKTPATASEVAVSVADAVPVAKVQLLNDRGDRRAEANWLTAAARPGVVELLSTSDDPFTIVTAHAGARTMRTARLDPDAGLALAIKVADLLAQLHHDGFVHGKLTVDHVIVGANGPVLCSPDGTVTTPEVDLDGLARCMRELARQWDEARATSAWRTQWDALAQRLEDATDPARSAVRVTQALRRMTETATPRHTPPTARRATRGLAAAAAIVVLAVAGISLVPTSTPAADGPRIVVDGSTYALGRLGDDVAYLQSPCDPGAPVVTLRPSTGEVWAFRSIDDNVQSEPVAVVPGATELRTERRLQGANHCDVAVARGPAGATDIDTEALMDDAGTSADPTIDGAANPTTSVDGG